MITGLPYDATTHTTPIGELLAMIERKAPLLMRAGGGGMEKTCDEGWKGRPIPEQVKRQITAHFKKTNDLRGTADRFKIHYQTACIITRHLRT